MRDKYFEEFYCHITSLVFHVIMDHSDHMDAGTFRAWQVGPRANSLGYYSSGKATDSDVYKVGIYGWRKRCLYVLILILIVVIMLNLALTIWIMRVLNFSLHGMGGLKIVNDGIHVTGKTEFDYPVSFGRMTTAGKNGDIKAFCDHFQIDDAEGRSIFYANKDEVGVRADHLKILGKSGGSIFNGSIQSRLIQPEIGHPLLLESPTRGLNVTAGHDVEILSRAGDIRAEALQSVYMESIAGEIHFNSPNIYMPRLIKAHDSGRGASRPQYQVCFCANGRLFLAKSGADCRSTAKLCE
uniref:Beta-sarcoglycan n=1 Tax=Romanomermis culicivorax TaxID=13658 RepID=A0A915KXV3_ROMCU